MIRCSTGTAQVLSDNINESGDCLTISYKKNKFARNCSPDGSPPLFSTFLSVLEQNQCVGVPTSAALLRAQASPRVQTAPCSSGCVRGAYPQFAAQHTSCRTRDSPAAP